MKEIIIVGPGGIGSTVAALLAHQGECDLTILGRPGAHIKTIQEKGLRLTGLRELVTPIKAIDDAAQIQHCDVLIYAVKAQHTEAALERTAHIEVRDFAASLQNGVIKDDQLARVFGRDKVLGALAVVAGERPEPGLARLTYDGGTQFGELDGGASARAEAITALFQQAGLTTHVSEAILSSTWTKMVGWIPIGLLSTLSGRNNAGVLSHTLLAAEYVGMVRELYGLAAAKEIPLINLGPYQVKDWCEGSVEAAIVKVLASPLASSQSTHSALQDIQKGQPSEFRACVGPMLEDAQASGIAITRTQTLYATLMGMEERMVEQNKGESA